MHKSCRICLTNFENKFEINGLCFICDLFEKHFNRTDTKPQ